MRRRLPLPVILGLLMLTLAACGGDEQPPSPTETPPPTATETPPPSATPSPKIPFTEAATEAALLRVVNASAAPRLTLTLDGAEVARSFRPGMYHSAPEKVRAGQYRLEVLASDQENPLPLLAETVTFEADAAYVLVLAGDADDLYLIVAPEDLSPLPRATARLQVIHALPGTGSLTIQDVQRTIIAGLPFGALSDPLTLAEGDHPLTLLTADTVPLAEVPFYGMARYAYTVVLFPDPDTGAPDTIALRSRVEDVAQMRVMHASPDLSAVDVLLDGELLAADLPYGEASAWTTQRAGSHQLQLRLAGQPDAEPILYKQVALQADQAVTLVILDTRDRLRIANVTEDLSPTPINAAWLVLVNAAVGTSQVTVSTFGGTLPEVRPIPFGQATHPLPLAAGRSGFVFETGAATAPREIGRVQERPWEPGIAYTIVLTGAPNAPVIVLETEAGIGETVLAEDGVVPLEGAPTAVSGWGPGASVFAMRVVHALPDRTPLDFLADGTLIFETIQAGTATAYHQFARPPQRLTVRVAGSALTLVEETATLPLVPEGTFLTVFVYRDGSNVQLLLASDNPLQIPDGYALVRVLHAIPDRPALRVERLSGPSTAETGAVATPTVPEDETSGAGAALAILADTVLFGQTSDPVLTPAGEALIHVIERVSLDPLGDFTFTLAPRTTYDLVLLPADVPPGVRAVLVAHEG
ncbi:MAG: hypothetical protein Kow00106_12580 [Anaerolineae bacterium]